MNLQHTRLHQRHQILDVINDDHILFLGLDRLAKFRIGDPCGHVLLEETVPLRSLRATHQRQRAIDNMGRNPIPNGYVIFSQLLLGDADIDPIDAVGMTQGHVCNLDHFFARRSDFGTFDAGRWSLCGCRTRRLRS